jgi:hypothetical protein
MAFEDARDKISRIPKRSFWFHVSGFWFSAAEGGLVVQPKTRNQSRAKRDSRTNQFQINLGKPET